MYRRRSRRGRQISDFGRCSVDTDGNRQAKINLGRLFTRFAIFFGKQLLASRVDVRANGVLGDPLIAAHCATV